MGQTLVRPYSSLCLVQFSSAWLKNSPVSSSAQLLAQASTLRITSSAGHPWQARAEASGLGHAGLHPLPWP